MYTHIWMPTWGGTWTDTVVGLQFCFTLVVVVHPQAQNPNSYQALHRLTSTSFLSPSSESLSWNSREPQRSCPDYGFESWSIARHLQGVCSACRGSWNPGLCSEWEAERFRRWGQQALLIHKLKVTSMRTMHWRRDSWKASASVWSPGQLQGFLHEQDSRWLIWQAQKRNHRLKGNHLENLVVCCLCSFQTWGILGLPCAETLRCPPSGLPFGRNRASPFGTLRSIWAKGPLE